MGAFDGKVAMVTYLWQMMWVACMVQDSKDGWATSVELIRVFCPHGMKIAELPSLPTHIPAVSILKSLVSDWNLTWRFLLNCLSILSCLGVEALQQRSQSRTCAGKSDMAARLLSMLAETEVRSGCTRSEQTGCEYPTCLLVASVLVSFMEFCPKTSLGARLP